MQMKFRLSSLSQICSVFLCSQPESASLSRSALYTPSAVPYYHTTLSKRTNRQCLGTFTTRKKYISLFTLPRLYIVPFSSLLFLSPRHVFFLSFKILLHFRSELLFALLGTEVICDTYIHPASSFCRSKL